MSQAYHLIPNQNPNQNIATSSKIAQQTDTYRQEIIPGDLCVGAIIWLAPRQADSPPIHCTKASCPNEEMEEGGYNHPVVVLKIRQKVGSGRSGDLVCTVAIMSTFRNTPLTQYTKSKSKDARFHHSIPMYHASSHSSSSSTSQRHTNSSEDDSPHQTKYLHLEKPSKRKLKKQGYVRYDHTFEIPLSCLRTYGTARAYKFRLREDSYGFLMKRVGLPLEVFEETATLFETASARLSALVATQRRVVGRTLPRPIPIPIPGIAAATSELDVVMPRAQVLRYGTVGSGEVMTGILPARDGERGGGLPIYVDRVSRLGESEEERRFEGGEGWGVGWLKIGIYTAVLAGVGFLVGWFWT